MNDLDKELREVKAELAVCKRALQNEISLHWASNQDLVECNRLNDARIELAREDSPDD